MIEFREDYDMWWPNTETSEALFGYMLNRVTDVDVAAKKCRTLGVAVQAGGFLGMWPARLSKFFERVYTFEPIDINYQTLIRNVRKCQGVHAFRAALGEVEAEVELLYRHGGRTTRVGIAEGAVTVKAQQMTIDSLKLTRCDAIFLDVESYEIQALNGGVKTIEKFSPVITVEFKEDTKEALKDWMKQHHYELSEVVHADMIFVRQK